MSKKSEKHSFLRNLSVDSSADASADAPAIINISKFFDQFITKEHVLMYVGVQFGSFNGF